MSHRVHTCIGYILFLLGLSGDSICGFVLLYGHSEFPLSVFLLLHVCAILMWASGIYLIAVLRANARGEPYRIGWVIASSILGVSLFPGFGPLAYSLAFCLIPYLPRGKSPFGAQFIVPSVRHEAYEPPERDVQPSIDLFRDGDIATKRATIAMLAHTPRPEAVQVLRSLLTDPSPDLRRDASVALTCLEDDLARTLNIALAAYVEQPENEVCALALIEQYDRYARSTLLDETSQQAYLMQARDLLQQMLEQKADVPCAELWKHLARIHSLLGEHAMALYDVQVALEYAPDDADTYLLATELAFNMRAWSVLIPLARAGARVAPLMAEVGAYAPWWAALEHVSPAPPLAPTRDTPMMNAGVHHGSATPCLSSNLS